MCHGWRSHCDSDSCGCSASFLWDRETRTCWRCLKIVESWLCRTPSSSTWGLIAHALAERGVDFTYVRPFAGDTVPTEIGPFQGLIVMGGPQSARDDAAFPYIKAEKDLVRDAVQAEIPMLGVCLGSQILAAVLGGRVSVARDFELGWKVVTLAAEIADDPVVGQLPSAFTPMHWHGEIFDLPPECNAIGSSTMTPLQGFVFRRHAFGLLFHLEMTEEQLAAMTRAFPEDVRRGRVNTADLLQQARARLETLYQPAMNLFGSWANLSLPSANGASLAVWDSGSLCMWAT